MRDAQSEYVRLIFQRLHHVAEDSSDLDAVNAHGFEMADAGARFIGIRGSRRLIEHPIGEDARRSNFAFRALFAKLQRFRSVAAHVANGSDSARHPHFEFVVEWFRDAATL